MTSPPWCREKVMVYCMIGKPIKQLSKAIESQLWLKSKASAAHRKYPLRHSFLDAGSNPDSPFIFHIMFYYFSHNVSSNYSIYIFLCQQIIFWTPFGSFWMPFSSFSECYIPYLYFWDYLRTLLVSNSRPRINLRPHLQKNLSLNYTQSRVLLICL